MNIKKHLPWLGALLPIINAQADTNPNVVIIYIDDMGIGDIGCYGGKRPILINWHRTDYCLINIILPHRLVHPPVVD